MILFEFLAQFLLNLFAHGGFLAYSDYKANRARTKKGDK